jgi:hypothetical protein
MRIRIRQVPPTPGSDCDTAYAVHLDRQGEPNVTIEYAAAGEGRYASSSHARHLVQDYLGRGERPPRRIVVDRTGYARPR